MVVDTTRSLEFPHELVASIVKYAAQSSRTACKTLCLVNSWCYLLALPYLFTTVVLPSPASGIQFTTMLSLRAKFRREGIPNQSVLKQTPWLPSEYVRNLWMHPALNRVYDLMACCRNVEHAAMDQETFQWLLCESAVRAWVGSQDRPLLVVKRNRPLQMLITDADASWNNDIVRSFEQGFESLPASDITHIHLAARGAMIYHDRMLRISPFSRLTHFTIPLYFHDLYDDLGARLEQQQVALARLLQDSTLQMLVCIPARAQDQDLAWGWLREVRRNYSNAYLVEPTGRDLREEWEDEVRGSESIWERAIKYTQEVAGDCP